VSLSSGTADHQGAQFKEAGIVSSDKRNPANSFSAKPFQNILIDEKEWLDRSYMAAVINNCKVSVLEPANKSIVQDLVVPMIFSLVGEG
jgi:glutathionylspermidine synthase